MSRINQGMFTSNRDDWETPEDLFRQYDDRFHFTLDVCATAKTAKCERYFTKEQNALVQDWTGERCWCNPPYGRTIGDFVKKAAESKALTVMLIPARTDTKWFHIYIYMHRPIEFIKGRIRFVGAESTAPFPSMIVIFDNLSE
jgi:phage N-6-adenine-methyltransferase